jgi:hypothetical protein
LGVRAEGQCGECGQERANGDRGGIHRESGKSLPRLPL